MTVRSRCRLKTTSILAEGLDIALKCTDVLYNGNAAALSTMSEDEMMMLSSNTETVRIILRPDTTVLEACLEAKCFGRKGMQSSQ